jgi:hypothetical protein
MLVRGGTPISKVRIDFSSNEDVQKILKNKRLLLDEENTSYPVQQYYPPFKILRCYNCQVYNDHVAANCPRKDNPICFRCGQNHPYNPNCTNKICCANCNEEHLAGNPSCKVKIEERNKCKSNMATANSHLTNSFKAPPSAWTTTTDRISTYANQLLTAGATSTLPDNSSRSASLDISSKLDLILTKIDNLTLDHDNLKSNLIAVNQQLRSCQDALHLLEVFITKQICPLILEVGEGVLGKKQDINKKKIRPLLVNVNQGLKSLTDLLESNINQSSSSTLIKSSSYESINEDI